MVVHGEPLDRPTHRVVGPEGDESLTDTERRACLAVEVAEDVLGREHQLMHVRVGVATVHVTFAPVAGSELAVRHRPAFEVRGRVERESQAGEADIEHDDRLHEAYFTEKLSACHGVGVRADEDPLAREAGRQPVLRSEGGERCPRRNEAEEGSTGHALPANPVILIPSTMNWTAMAQSTSPMSRVRMRMPVWPRRCSTAVAAARTT